MIGQLGRRPAGDNERRFPRRRARYHNWNLMPCASGRSDDQLMVVVWRRMYAFQESLPASRPPPVSFSPPKAPPISAPLVPILMLAMPQSLPRALRKVSAEMRLVVNIAEDRPCGTALCHSITSSS